MASTLENALRLVKPGEMVVSLTDILDKLGNKITAEEREQLLIAMLSPRREKMQPGDLISADLVNQVLAELADLRLRVEALSGQATSLTLRLFSIDGPTPIRVSSRVTVKGQNFSKPSGRNSVTLDGTPVDTIPNASDDRQLVFDVPDPGLAGVGRIVNLYVVNADGQNDHLPFRLEPPIVVPYGALAVTYVQPPAGTYLNAGEYVFGFKLLASVDKEVNVRFLASIGTVAGWEARIYRTTGEEITVPVNLPKQSEMTFNVKVKVPSTGPADATLQIAAEETSSGTHVTPSPALVYALIRGGKIPTTENRVTVKLENTSSNVTLPGGTVQFTKGQWGKLDFAFSFDLGAGVTGSTNFSWSFRLDDTTSSGWTMGDPETSGTSVTGAVGTGSTSLVLTPSITAQGTRLYLTLNGSPLGQQPVNVTYSIPLLVQ